ncbi:MAG: Ldh family oxidoreductase [Candidatus Latescibacteria bacterium]|nr:Ldh family oxidoreductase [Candidatus Latescibacterota bacterium]
MPRFTPDYLIETGSRIFAAAGSPPEQARTVAELLVEANTVGHDSHGVIRIPQYLAMIEQGDIDPGADIAVLRDMPAAAVLDAQWAFGQVAMSRAVAMARDKASQTGVAAVTLRRDNHIGRLGSYVDLLARDNMIGLLFVNGTPTCRMAPWGGTEARLGTNPLATGIPTREGAPIILDMTTTVVAEGKVRVQRNRNQPAPDGWLLDAQGQPTNDPNVLYSEPRGTILPLGGSVGHKGFGLNVAVELLAGALSGSGCVGQDRQFSNGVLLMAINVAHFTPLDQFHREVSDFVAFVKSSPTAPGYEQIYMPGEIEAQVRQQRLAEGLLIEEETWQQITACADQLGCSLDN